MLEHDNFELLFTWNRSTVTISLFKSSTVRIEKYIDFPLMTIVPSF